MHQKSKFLKGVIAVIFALSVPSLAAAATVTRILDGDTLEVTEGKTTLRVRLINIDAPEKPQPYGQRSRQFLSDLVKGATDVAVKAKGNDRYGRTLADVYVKKCEPACLAYHLNSEMVKSGMAWAYRYKGKASSPAMQELEQIAHKSRLGLWQDDHAIEPWQWRQLQKQKDN